MSSASVAAPATLTIMTNEAWDEVDTNFSAWRNVAAAAAAAIVFVAVLRAVVIEHKASRNFLLLFYIRCYGKFRSVQHVPKLVFGLFCRYRVLAACGTPLSFAPAEFSFGLCAGIVSIIIFTATTELFSSGLPFTVIQFRIISKFCYWFHIHVNKFNMCSWVMGGFCACGYA